MPELDPLGWSLVTWVVGVSAWTAAVYGLARGLDATTRRVLGPRLRLLLYAAVLVRLLLPLDVQTPVGIGGWGSTAATITRAKAPELQAGHGAASAALEDPRIDHTMLTSTTQATTATAVAALDSPPSAALMATTSATSTWPWGLLALVVYGLGVLICLGLWAARERRIRAWIAASTPSPLAASFAAGVDLREHPSAGPFAHGLRQPVVIVPANLEAQLRPEILTRLLAHERAHHEHGDPWLVAALMAVASFAWPVLPVWLTLRRARRLIEEAADERALRGAGAAVRRAYGKALIELAERTATISAPAPAPLPALGAFGQLRSRITTLARPVTTPRWAQLGLGLGLTVALAACMAPGEDPKLPDTNQEIADCEELKSGATMLHDAAQKGEAEYELALVAYHDYLDACEHDSDYVNMLYYAGEAHWARAAARDDAQDYRRAAELFRRVLDHDSDYELDAAYGQLLSTFNALDWSDERPAPTCEGECEGFPPLPYDEDERALIDSWARYLAAIDRPFTHAREQQQPMAKLFMQHNDFERARPELEELVRLERADAAGVHAAEMLVDLLTIAWLEPGISPAEALRRGDELEGWLVELEEAPLHAHASAGALRDAVTTLRAGVEWRRAMADMAAGEAGEAAAYGRCAAGFEALAAAHPEHDQLDAIERNAAVCRAHAQ